MLTLRNVGGCLSPPEIAVSGCKVTNINCKPKAPAKKILLPAKYPPRARVPTPVSPRPCCYAAMRLDLGGGI